MCGKLYFSFQKTESPYAKYKITEVWGVIQLVHVENSNRKYILDWQWNVNEISEWFNENKNFLLEKELNVFNPEEKSIAELRDIAFDRKFFFSEDEQHDYYEKVDSCFSLFWFHLRGTPTPVHYIGKNSGTGEISYYNQHDNIYERYFFNMEDFVFSTENALRSFLNEFSK